MSASSPVSAPAQRAPLADLVDDVLSRVHPYLLRLGVAGVGALLACSFAPLQWWALAILCPAVLMLVWESASPRAAAWLGFWFTFGTFFVGTIWLYTGLHVMGGAPSWMAFGLMLGLTSIMALYHAGVGYVVARWVPVRLRSRRQRDRAP